MVFRVIVLSCLAIMLSLTPARAQELDVFTVRNVPVDVKARTAAQARDIALLRGQRAALKRLFARITLRADRDWLPALSDRQVPPLIQGVEIENEKTSSTRYLANLTIRFNKGRVRALLRSAGVPFTETVAKPVLILPIFESGASRVLWDDPNPWRAAWDRRRAPDSLHPIIVPLGDLEDLLAVDAVAALEGRSEALRAIAGRYQADETLVAHARLEFDEFEGTPLIQVILRRFGPLGERVVVEEFAGDSGGLLDSLLIQIADLTAGRLEEEWKAITVLDFNAQTKLSTQVPVVGLGDWLEVRRRLGEVAMVRKVDLQSLSTEGAQVMLHYLGNSQQLVLSLAQSDLDLTYDDGFWALNMRQRVAPVDTPGPVGVGIDTNKEPDIEPNFAGGEQG